MDGSAELKKLLSEWAIEPDCSTALQMVRYYTLLTKWNARINLTASTDWQTIGPMFREAIWASRLYPADRLTHLDIGSGAGFPALLFKMLMPRIQLDLVESRERKCQFLETAVSSLGLENVQIRQTRLSEYLVSCPREKSWDCISWKALKLSTADVRQLHARGLQKSQFWMFHGRLPALEDSNALNLFSLLRKEIVPGMQDAYLSIYM